MCFTDTNAGATTAPEETLAKLLERRLGGTIDPVALRALIIDHWGSVSTLAHRIHDKGMPAAGYNNNRLAYTSDDAGKVT